MGFGRMSDESILAEMNGEHAEICDRMVSEMVDLDVPAYEAMQGAAQYMRGLITATELIEGAESYGQTWTAQRLRSARIEFEAADEALAEEAAVNRGLGSKLFDYGKAVDEALTFIAQKWGLDKADLDSYITRVMTGEIA